MGSYSLEIRKTSSVLVTLLTFGLVNLGGGKSQSVTYISSCICLSKYYYMLISSFRKDVFLLRPLEYHISFHCYMDLFCELDERCHFSCNAFYRPIK